MELTKEKRQKLLKEIKTDKDESEYMIKELIDIDCLDDQKLIDLSKIYSDLWHLLYKLSPDTSSEN